MLEGDRIVLAITVELLVFVKMTQRNRQMKEKDETIV